MSKTTIKPKAAKAVQATPSPVLAPSVLITPAAMEPIAATEPLRPIDRLDQAQALPELERDVVGTDSPARPAKTAIEVFKGIDRRTMRVVVLDGTLYQQAI